MVLHAAWRMDTVRNKVAAKEIAMVKVLGLNNCIQVIDDAMQALGVMGLSQDTLLVSFEVHRNTIAKHELSSYRQAQGRAAAAIEG